MSLPFHGLGRFLRRRLRRLTGASGPWYVHHAGYRLGLPGVSIDPLRASRILTYLLDEGLALASDVVRPISASLDRIGLVHRPAYLESLDRVEALEPVLGFNVTDDERQRIIDHQRLVTGGTIHAARLALKTGRIGVNLGGGYHHACPDRGQAFCVFNDVAVAIARLRRKRFRKPVLVVDLDIHDGNGTRACFATDPTVYTFSIHNHDWDPIDTVASSSIALGDEVSDDRYLSTLGAELPRLLAQHRPGLVFYIAGADPAADDPVGNWRISERALVERDRFVVEQVLSHRARTPLVVLLGGGYGERAWRHSARFFAGLVSTAEHEPRTELDSVVRMFRRFEREPPDVAARQDSDWELSEEDLALPGIRAGTDQRFLGALSKHAVELSLERVGILDQLRASGFRHTLVELEATPPLGHTLRILDAAEDRALLIEQRVSRNRSAVADAELLYAEWLMLQNPRASFGRTRRPLPGQRHPGLGLLREIVAWWIVLAERLSLDGILFVPSHFYMAALGQRHLRFLDPEDAAVFAALRDAVEGLELAEASVAIDAGRVVDASGRSVAWHAPLMVLPVGGRLRDRVFGTDYDATVDRVRSELNYSI